jgi:hypothetical protein
MWSAAPIIAATGGLTAAQTAALVVAILCGVIGYWFAVQCRRATGVYPWRLPPIIWGLLSMFLLLLGLLLETVAWFTTRAVPPDSRPTSLDLGSRYPGNWNQPGNGGATGGQPPTWPSPVAPVGDPGPDPGRQAATPWPAPSSAPPAGSPQPSGSPGQPAGLPAQVPPAPTPWPPPQAPQPAPPPGPPPGQWAPPPQGWPTSQQQPPQPQQLPPRQPGALPGPWQPIDPSAPRPPDTAWPAPLGPEAFQQPAPVGPGGWQPPVSPYVPAVTPPPLFGWYPDPTGRHEERYWDGRFWSDRVSDGGERSEDALGAT